MYIFFSVTGSGNGDLIVSDKKRKDAKNKHYDRVWIDPSTMNKARARFGL